MRRNSHRFTMVAGLAVAGAVLFSGPGTGCTSFLAESALAPANFCFIFDCQNGLLGGTLDPCPPVDIFSGGSLFTPPTGPLFTDCP